jgi:hypothetical protein
MTGKAGATLDASGPMPTLRDQSLHFANRNPAKSMKTSHGRNFNRYTFRVSGFVLVNPESKKDLCEPCDSVASRSLGRFARSSSPCRNPNNETAIRNRRK